MRFTSSPTVNVLCAAQGEPNANADQKEGIFHDARVAERCAAAVCRGWCPTVLIIDCTYFDRVPEVRELGDSRTSVPASVMTIVEMQAKRHTGRRSGNRAGPPRIYIPRGKSLQLSVNGEH